MLRLPIRSTKSTFQRLPKPNLLANMSSKAYILPIDPSAPGSRSALPNIDPANLWATVPASAKTPKVGTTRLFYGVPSGGSNVTALVSLGDAYEVQKGDGKRELVRKAVGNAVKDVKALGEGKTLAVSVDASADPHAAGKFAHSIYSEFTCTHPLGRSCRCSLGTLQIHVENRPSVGFQTRSQTVHSRTTQVRALDGLKGVGCWHHCCQSPKSCAHRSFFRCGWFTGC